jgi:uncharacterized protein (TIGR02145 family)
MRLTLTTLALLISVMLFAQAPALIPYQAIARNAAGEPLANSTLNARFTIHDGTAAGPSVWQELQTVTTSSLGLFTVQLGSSISLSGVNWAAGAKFMQVEIDLGSGFVDIGTQQLLSVPYALHSASSLSAGDGISNISITGDTLFLNNGAFLVVPGISAANSKHTCGAPNIHNPNLTYGSMTDQEGNVYKTIVIGFQEWMAENLNTSIYRNGDPIPTGLSDADWENTINTEQGAWAYFNDDASYACPYGKLYNWFACVDSRQLCPLGWHLPSRGEWDQLALNLEGDELFSGGGKMKTIGIIEAGTGLWNFPNTGANNSSGFSGVPGGRRNSMGQYYDLHFLGFWWADSNDFILNDAWALILNSTNDQAFTFIVYGGGYVTRQTGVSVRCLKD